MDCPEVGLVNNNHPGDLSLLRRETTETLPADRLYWDLYCLRSILAAGKLSSNYHQNQIHIDQKDAFPLLAWARDK